MRDLQNQCSNMISDKPGFCLDFVYTIKLKLDAKPVHSHPYCMSPQQQERLRGEIDQLLQEMML